MKSRASGQRLFWGIASVCLCVSCDGYGVSLGMHIPYATQALYVCVHALPLETSPIVSWGLGIFVSQGSFLCAHQ